MVKCTARILQIAHRERERERERCGRSGVEPETLQELDPKKVLKMEFGSSGASDGHGFSY